MEFWRASERQDIGFNRIIPCLLVNYFFGTANSKIILILTSLTAYYKLFMEPFSVWCCNVNSVWHLKVNNMWLTFHITNYITISIECLGSHGRIICKSLKQITLICSIKGHRIMVNLWLTKISAVKLLGDLQLFSY